MFFVAGPISLSLRRLRPPLMAQMLFDLSVHRCCGNIIPHALCFRLDCKEASHGAGPATTEQGAKPPCTLVER